MVFGSIFAAKSALSGAQSQGGQVATAVPKAFPLSPPGRRCLEEADEGESHSPTRSPAFILGVLVVAIASIRPMSLALIRPSATSSRGEKGSRDPIPRLPSHSARDNNKIEGNNVGAGWIPA